MFIGLVVLVLVGLRSFVSTDFVVSDVVLEELGWVG